MASRRSSASMAMIRNDPFRSTLQQFYHMKMSAYPSSPGQMVERSRLRISPPNARLGPAHPRGFSSTSMLNAENTETPLSPASRLPDGEHALETLRLPDEDDYPMAKKSAAVAAAWELLRNRKARGFIHCLKLQQIRQNELRLRTEFEQLKGPPETMFRCHVIFESTTHTEVVSGEGKRKATAESAAFLQLVVRFHENGILRREMLESPTHPWEISGDDTEGAELQKDPSAMKDVLNYCAGFDLLPVCTRERIKREASSKTEQIHKVEIKLPEQGISCSGYGKALLPAEIRAAMAFKAEVKSSKVSPIKGHRPFNTENAKQFIDFYNQQRSADIDGEPIEEAWAPYIVQATRDGQRFGPKFGALELVDAVEMMELATAVTLKKQSPETYSRYLEALVVGNGKVLEPAQPVKMDMNDDCLLMMRDTLVVARRAGLPDHVDDVGADVPNAKRKKRRPDNVPSDSTKKGLSRQLMREMEKYKSDHRLASLRVKRENLPVNQHKDAILDMVDKHQYSIIMSATGSGKSTQVPQIFLESAISRTHGADCNIICTQPRRMATTAVARRVADERAEPLGQTVGYQVRGDRLLADLAGSINYCTSGVLLRQLLEQPDFAMENYSHLVIDEVHERDVIIDFLLTTLKRIMAERIAKSQRVPKVILMSATLDSDLFSKYFQVPDASGNLLACGSLSVPGRLFPVKERYLDDIMREIHGSKSPTAAIDTDKDSLSYLISEKDFQDRSRYPLSNTTPTVGRNTQQVHSPEGNLFDRVSEEALVPVGLMANTIGHILKTSTEGAILVFLPGIQEILKVHEALRVQRNVGIDINDAKCHRIYMLHSSIADTQTTVFQEVPPGCRKIILSTNVAETSVTIPDVQFVVDSGKLRESWFDPVRRTSGLKCTWISRSNVKQRSGRAGRVQDGHYYALFSRERLESLQAMGLPEMLRVDLQNVCLDVKAQAVPTPVQEFLAEAIQPPAPQNIEVSLNHLERIGALTTQEDITPLGRLLAKLGLQPNLGKMIMLGIIFRCLDPMIILGSVDRPIFVNPLERRTEAALAKLAFVEGTGSDHIAILNALRELRRTKATRDREVLRAFANKNFLHLGAFRMLLHNMDSVQRALIESGLVPSSDLDSTRTLEIGGPRLNENSHRTSLIRALLLAGLHPNLALAQNSRRLRTPTVQSCLIHPASVNAHDINPVTLSKKPMPFEVGQLFSYSDMVLSNIGTTRFARDTTPCTPLMVALFGGRLHEEPLSIDRWIPLDIRTTQDKQKAAKTLMEFRKALDRVLASAFNSLRGLTNATARGMDGLDESGDSAFLMDDEVTRVFANGVAEVMDRDSPPEETVKTRGWAAQALPVVP